MKKFVVGILAAAALLGFVPGTSTTFAPLNSVAHAEEIVIEGDIKTEAQAREFLLGYFAECPAKEVEKYRNWQADGLTLYKMSEGFVNEQEWYDGYVSIGSFPAEKKGIKMWYYRLQEGEGFENVKVKGLFVVDEYGVTYVYDYFSRKFYQQHMEGNYKANVRFSGDILVTTPYE